MVEDGLLRWEDVAAAIEALHGHDETARQKAAETLRQLVAVLTPMIECLREQRAEYQQRTEKATANLDPTAPSGAVAVASLGALASFLHAFEDFRQESLSLPIAHLSDVIEDARKGRAPFRLSDGPVPPKREHAKKPEDGSRSTFGRAVRLHAAALSIMKAKARQDQDKKVLRREVVSLLTFDVSTGRARPGSFPGMNTERLRKWEDAEAEELASHLLTRFLVYDRQPEARLSPSDGLAARDASGAPARVDPARLAAAKRAVASGEWTATPEDWQRAANALEATLKALLPVGKPSRKKDKKDHSDNKLNRKTRGF